MARAGTKRGKVGRDPTSGRFVPARVLIPTPSGLRHPQPVRVPRRDPDTGKYIPRAGPPRRPPAQPRHPRTGRFITPEQDALIRKKRVTQADLRRILAVSPKMRRRLRDLAGPMRRVARRRMLRGLREYRDRAREALHGR